MKHKPTFIAAMLTAFLVLNSAMARSQLSARELLDKSRDYEELASSVSRVDTSAQATVAVVGTNRVEQVPQTNIVKVEIDRLAHRARQTASIEGKELVMLRQDEKSAMKLGTGPWEIPSGPYEKIAKDLGNLFACEQETPETAKNAPVWTVIGTERTEGIEALVIATEGNSAVPLAQERMTKGMAGALAGNSGAPATVKVIQYSSKHWISKADYRPLQAVQTSKYEVRMVFPGGQSAVIETSCVTTSKYGFDKVNICVPVEAQVILSSQSR